jgi:NAD(P)-dependent dehydrogenase (short-subunit alcohol dehydrogenase family)
MSGAPARFALAPGAWPSLSQKWVYPSARAGERRMELSGKTAIVTGGARGIGRAIALRLAMERAAVVVVDCDETEGHRAVAEINEAGCEASFVGADVTRDEDVEAMIGETERRYAGLDVLVNNAGGYQQPVFPDAPLEQWARTLDLNLRSVMVATQFAVRASTSWSLSPGRPFFMAFLTIGAP